MKMVETISIMAKVSHPFHHLIFGLGGFME